jgi:hypothetical protein
MKLLYCPRCKDIKKLRRLSKTGDKPTQCTCGKCWGYYKENGHNAVVGRGTTVLGINNCSFFPAIRRGSGAFGAWVMKDNPRIEIQENRPPVINKAERRKIKRRIWRSLKRIDSERERLRIEAALSAWFTNFWRRLWY